MVAVHEGAHGLDTDVGSEQEKAGGDQLLGESLGTLRAEAGAGEQPEDDEAGERLDQAAAPKAIKAIEPAASPAKSAIANSTRCPAMTPHASRRARCSYLARSAGAAAAAG